jgi:hypothetical protein
VADIPSSSLDAPLGAPEPAAPPRLWPRRLGWTLAAAPFAVIAAGVGYVALRGDPQTARPSAVSVIRPAEREPGRPAGPQDVAAAPIQQTPAERSESSAGQLEDDAGVRVLRPGANAPNAVIIRVPDANPSIRLNPAPDRRLVERTRHGQLPKIGEDGARAFQIYARPAPATLTAGQPRIAIIVGGMGISAAATAEAISRLPGEISFAFAPYGGELERQVARARADGHEVFVQAPMEPFDYPDNDPGPHTLTTNAGAEDNLEKLRWVLGRFPGYVGVVNFMGARFTADEQALAPVMREIAQRGLMVVDDGSAGRSQMAATANGFRTPALRADSVLDGVLRAEMIDRELAALEKTARDKGVALASASAMPLTVERLQRWARTLEQKGIRLVPVSSLGMARAQITGSVRQN